MMSYQWNASGLPNRQDRTGMQPFRSQWPNQEQFNPANMTPNSFHSFPDSTALPNADWNSGSYPQWPSSAPQDQMNWGCQQSPPVYPGNNIYNSNPALIPQTSYASNNAFHQQQNYTSQPQNQMKPDYSSTSTPGVYGNADKNVTSTYNFGMGSVNYYGNIGTQGNSTFNMTAPQNNMVNNSSNCQECPSKTVHGNMNPMATNDSFPYWDSNRNVGNNNGVHNPYNMNPACDKNINMTPSTMALNTPKAEPSLTHGTNEILPTFVNRTEIGTHRPNSQPETSIPGLPSSNSSSDYFMGMMPQQSVAPTPNLMPIQKHETPHNSYGSFCPMNSLSSSGMESNFSPPKYSRVMKDNMSAGGGDYHYGNMCSVKKNTIPSTKRTSFVNRENEARNDGLPQKRTLGIESAPQNQNLSGPGKKKRMVEETFFEKSFRELYAMNREVSMATLASQQDPKETVSIQKSKVTVKSAFQDAPSCMELNTGMQGSSHNSDFGLAAVKSEILNELSGTSNASLECCAQNTGGDLKSESSSSTAQFQTNQDPLSDICFPKNVKNEDKVNSNGTKKGSGKKLRRAIFKYLLKLSGMIECSFSDLRIAKSKLREDHKDQQVLKILCKVNLQIKQMRLSLAEKKRLCKKNNIELRNLTIKSTGAKILETLEGDMYHLRKFYTALSHISNNIDLIRKPSNQDSTDEMQPSSIEAMAKPSSSTHLDCFDEECDGLPADQFGSHLSLQDGLLVHGNISGNLAFRNKNLVKEMAQFNGPPQKTAQFMHLEKRYWDKLNELVILLRTKNEELKTAEQNFKKGDSQSEAALRSLCEVSCVNLKNDVKLIFHWKNKYNFSRKIPSYILRNIPEEERWARDKMTLKCLQKEFDSFMKLSYKGKIMTRSSTAGPNESDSDSLIREARYWQRLTMLVQKLKMCQTEIRQLKVTLLSQRPCVTNINNQSVDSVLRVESRIKEIEFDVNNEEQNRQKNGFSKLMPSNPETEKLKLNPNECRDVNVPRELLQHLWADISELRCRFQIPMTSNQQISDSTMSLSTTASSYKAGLPGGNSMSFLAPAQMQQPKMEPPQMQQVPNSLAHFLGTVSDDWI